jgi:hypothetical protein
MAFKICISFSHFLTWKNHMCKKKFFTKFFVGNFVWDLSSTSHWLQNIQTFQGENHNYPINICNILNRRPHSLQSKFYLSNRMCKKWHKKANANGRHWNPNYITLRCLLLEPLMPFGWYMNLKPIIF